MKVFLSLALSFFFSATTLFAGITTVTQEGRTSAGNDFYIVPTETTEQCADLCLSKKLCSLAVFNNIGNRCYLKTKSTVYESCESCTLILKILEGQDNLDYIKGDYSSI